MIMTRLERLAEPWSDLMRFRQDMGRLFDTFGREWPVLGRGFPGLKVWQDDDNFFVEAELPGMDLNDLEIYVTGGDQLTIKGERKPPQIEKAIWHRQERGFGKFTRTLRLPAPVEADGVQAKLSGGVLTITLPKSPAAKPKKIAVQAE